jgi:hypothetical protein
MLSRVLLAPLTALVALTVSPGLLFAAAPPAPRPAPVATATAVIGVTARGGDLPDRFLGHPQGGLRHWRVVRAALSRPEVANLPCLKGRPGAEAWVIARLKTRLVAEAKEVHVSLEGCPPKEAVTLLNAVLTDYFIKVDYELRTCESEADRLRQELDGKLRRGAYRANDPTPMRYVETIERQRAWAAALRRLRVVKKPQARP